MVEPELCTPGRYCAENATTLWGHGPCAEGYLCPAGTGTPTPASSKCPAGWYCASGSSSPSSLCQPGYYCPEGSSSPRSYLCPAGSFCYAGSAEPALCPAGSWSSTPGRFTACNLCPASTYSGAVGATNYTSCKDCPAGFQCPSAGMAAPLPCPAGAKSAPTGLSCVECPAGTFNQMPGNNASDPCSPCPAGHICRAGTVYPEGALGCSCRRSVQTWMYDWRAHSLTETRSSDWAAAAFLYPLPTPAVPPATRARAPPRVHGPLSKRTCRLPCRHAARLHWRRHELRAVHGGHLQSRAAGLVPAVPRWQRVQRRRVPPRALPGWLLRVRRRDLLRRLPARCVHASTARITMSFHCFLAAVSQ